MVFEMQPPPKESSFPPDGESATEPADPKSEEATREAVAVARLAAASWSKVPLHRRLVLLRKARHRIAARAGSLAGAGRSDGATAGPETLAGEVLPLLDACRLLEREARKVLAPRRPGGRGRPFWLGGIDLEVFRAPLGVVWIVGTSRHPLFVPGVHAIQALAAGNSVIFEPGEGGMAVAKVLQDCLVDSGLDSWLFQVLPEAGAARDALRGGVEKVLLASSVKTAERGHGSHGVLRGAEGLLELTRVKAVAVGRRKSRRHTEELQPEDDKIIDSYLRAAHGGTLRERLAARATLLKSLRKGFS
jgi:acyl-CoA reductase-like NAD-dependent aldehyde dehydrogenase